MKSAVWHKELLEEPLLGLLINQPNQGEGGGKRKKFALHTYGGGGLQ